jgi:hypothetical protein
MKRQAKPTKQQTFWQMIEFPASEDLEFTINIAQTKLAFLAYIWRPKKALSTTSSGKQVSNIRMFCWSCGLACISHESHETHTSSATKLNKKAC